MGPNGPRNTLLRNTFEAGNNRLTTRGSTTDSTLLFLAASGGSGFWRNRGADHSVLAVHRHHRDERHRAADLRGSRPEGRLLRRVRDQNHHSQVLITPTRDTFNFVCVCVCIHHLSAKCSVLSSKPEGQVVATPLLPHKWYCHTQHLATNVEVNCCGSRKDPGCVSVSPWKTLPLSLNQNCLFLAVDDVPM